MTDTMNGHSKSVLVMGATGAIGSHLVTQLLQLPQVSRVTALTRRALPDIADNPKLVTYYIIM